MNLHERAVRRAVIGYLSRQGYARNLREKETHEHGADIKVRHNRYPRYFVVETKGEYGKKSGSENAFVNALGQIVTRINPATGYFYGLGLPESSAKIAVRRIPWQVAKVLRLSVLSVSRDLKVTEYTWKEIRQKRE